MKNRFAFTLAEVLIALGVIGVVAAMTLPNVIQNYQKKQTIVRLKKVMNTVNQAYQRSYQDNGNPEEDMVSQEYWEKYWKPYIKSPILCSSTNNYCGYRTLLPYKYPNGNTESTALFSDNKYFAIKTIDGYILRFSARNVNCTTSNDHCKLATIDINGAQGPNRYGRDVFVLIRNDNKISYDTYCFYNDKNYMNNECKYYGTCCARKIVKDNWEILEDYPW